MIKRIERFDSERHRRFAFRLMEKQTFAILESLLSLKLYKVFNILFGGHTKASKAYIANG